MNTLLGKKSLFLYFPDNEHHAIIKEQKHFFELQTSIIF